MFLRLRFKPEWLTNLLAPQETQKMTQADVLQYQPAVIAQAFLLAMQDASALRNKQYIAAYQNDLANYNLNVTQTGKTGVLPTPPLLQVVNADVVMDMETNTDYSGKTKYVLFSYVPYVPIVAPPTENDPTAALVVFDNGMGAMGLFSMTGDSPAIPANTVILRSGHHYKKIVVGTSFTGPSYLWQQIS